MKECAMEKGEGSKSGRVGKSMGFFLSVAFFGSSLLPYFSGLWGVGEGSYCVARRPDREYSTVIALCMSLDLMSSTLHLLTTSRAISRPADNQAKEKEGGEKMKQKGPPRPPSSPVAVE